jgi:hypothetical protein
MTSTEKIAIQRFTGRTPRALKPRWQQIVLRFLGL